MFSLKNIFKSNQKECKNDCSEFNLMTSSCDVTRKDGTSEEAIQFLLNEYNNKRISEIEFYTLLNKAMYIVSVNELIEKYKPLKVKNKVINRTNKLNAYIGGIFGDIIGSPLEGVMNRYNVKIEDMMQYDLKFTDDTVLMVATKEALKKDIKYRTNLSLEDFKIANTFPYVNNPFVNIYKTYGKKYENCGFGEKFYKWVKSSSCEPYGSYGNGSAMRIGIVSDYFDSIDKVIEYSIASAAVTHNHPEGIKGAVVIAVMCWMAKNGYSKEEIMEYMKRFYNLERSCKYAMPHIKTFDYKGFANSMGREVCQYTVPMAVFCFYESDNYEDAINHALCLMGDIDTICSITGALAGSYYGVPDNIEAFVQTKIKDI